MTISTDLRNLIRQHLLRTASWTKPTTIYVALHTGDPGADGTANEVSGGAYARVQRDPLDANWTAESTAGLAKNAAAITFPVPTANWGTVSHVSLKSASTGGTNFLHGALVTPRTINNGDPAPSFPISDLSVAFE